jgi:peptidyl-dipeptidase Dcp
MSKLRTTISDAHASAQNPLLRDWKTPFAAPPFAKIKTEHFRPAFDAALAAHEKEIDAIANSDAAPTFENTIEALERGGKSLRQVSMVFFNLSGADTNEALEKIERDIAPILAKHRSAIYQNEPLFRRIDTLKKREAELGLTPEQSRVLERSHLGFVRSGAALGAEKKKRLAEITERLAVLGTQFGQNVLADERAYTLLLEGKEDLAGLSEAQVESAAKAASERELTGKRVITLSRSSIEPFLQFSTRRDLREAAFKAWIARGENGGATDNRAIIAEMVKLRDERAKLLGYANFAVYRLDDTMAKTPEAAMGLLNSVWKRGRAKAEREAVALQKLIQSEGGNFRLAPWDWRYYSEKRRKAEFDFDEDSIKPYLQLDKIIEAAFYTAGKLFGLRFKVRADVPVYHPDVRAWEVSDADGRHVGIFLGDYFARPSKRSGAWMSQYRGQEKLEGDIRPIVVNVKNFSKGGDGGPTLISFEDARTLFHEFGHGLHGLLSDVTYRAISGTAVATDFVEFPSQLFEHWLEEPELLRRFALHYRTGEPMREEMLKRMLSARNFNQGFATVEYTACALLDLDLHRMEAVDDLDIDAFERDSLRRIGMPEAIVMRHRPAQFGHLFTGDHYAAGYYSYLWSEVLDADGFAAFKEAGDIFDPATAKRLKEFVYSAGYLREPAEAYKKFRGRMPEPDALMRKRGLVEAPAAEA